MPVYEYRCQSCERITEAMQKLSDPPLVQCEECGGELRKIISRSAFHLKGSGWYSDHYGLKSPGEVKKDSGQASSSGKSADSSGKDDAKPGAKAEAKPEPKPESKGEASATPSTSPASAPSSKSEAAA